MGALATTPKKMGSSAYREGLLIANHSNEPSLSHTVVHPIFSVRPENLLRRGAERNFPCRPEHEPFSAFDDDPSICPRLIGINSY